MNDWRHDTPDDDPGECETAQSDPEPEDCYIGDMKPPMAPKLGPHGQELAECNTRMIAGDLAFDVARESRTVGPVIATNYRDLPNLDLPPY